MNKLINCGCGGEPHLDFARSWNPEKKEWISSSWHRVICRKCETQTIAFSTEAEAVEVWNHAMGAKGINVINKNIVIIKPFTADMNHVGYCKCGYLINTEWKYCPTCGARLEWE